MAPSLLTKSPTAGVPPPASADPPPLLACLKLPDWPTGVTTVLLPAPAAAAAAGPSFSREMALRVCCAITCEQLPAHEGAAESSACMRSNTPDPTQAAFPASHMHRTGLLSLMKQASHASRKRSRTPVVGSMHIPWLQSQH